MVRAAEFTISADAEGPFFLSAKPFDLNYFHKSSGYCLLYHKHKDSIVAHPIHLIGYFTQK